METPMKGSMSAKFTKFTNDIYIESIDKNEVIVYGTYMDCTFVSPHTMNIGALSHKYGRFCEDGKTRFWPIDMNGTRNYKNGNRPTLIQSLEVLIDAVKKNPQTTYIITEIEKHTIGEEHTKFIADNLYNIMHLKNVRFPLSYIEAAAFPYVDGYIRCRSGNYVNVINPDPVKIVLSDIVYGLARHFRYAGQSMHKYTVATHSVVMAKYFIRENDLESAKQALFHDAFEGYAGDIPRPLKVFMPQFSQTEDLWMEIIARKYDFGWPMNKSVKEYDSHFSIFDEWNKYVVTDNNLQDHDPMDEHEEIIIRRFVHTYVTLFPDKIGVEYLGKDEFINKIAKEFHDEIRGTSSSVSVNYESIG